MSSLFDKIEDFVLHGGSFIKTLFHHWIFSQNFFLRRLVFETYSKKDLWWSLFIDRFVTLLEKLHHIRFPKKFRNFRNQLSFVTLSFVFKNQITRKITRKSGVKPWKRDDSSTFRTEYCLISNIRENRTSEREQHT